MKSQQSDRKASKQIRIDTGYHKLLKLRATEEGVTIKKLLEGYLSEMLEVKQKN